MNSKGGSGYSFQANPMFRAVLTLADGSRMECPKHFNKKMALADAIKYGDLLLGNLSEMNIETI